MEILKEKIKEKDKIAVSKQQSQTFPSYTIEDDYLDFSYSNQDIQSPIKILFNTEDINNDEIKIPIYEKDNSFEGNDLLTKLLSILEKENISQIEKNRVINLFRSFNEYLSKNRSKRNIMNLNEYSINKAKARIKINDVNFYINSRYKNGKNSTIIHMKIKMRKYIRLLNDEPNLNFREKITRNCQKDEKIKSKDSQLIIIVKHLMYKSNLLHILLFYFLYFVGLNYSLVSRIMIKNFKNGFKSLILKKGCKTIKHFFPKMIIIYYFTIFVILEVINLVFFLMIKQEKKKVNHEKRN